MDNRLFVYGIFLDQINRDRYGMYDATYTTVKDYVTYGNRIVEAYHQPNKGLALTGLSVTVDENRWPALDQLEHGYNRIKVRTTDGETLWMYAGKDM